MGLLGCSCFIDRIQADAIENLDFAIEEFHKMKMQPYLEQAIKQKKVWELKMKCPHCQFDNEFVEDYCGEFGHHLTD